MLPGPWPATAPSQLTCAAMSLPELKVGVLSTHGFVGVRVLFEQRSAELSAALDGYGDHDVGDRGQRTVLTGGDRQDSSAEVGSAPGEVQRNGGFCPMR